LKLTILTAENKVKYKPF